MKPSNHHKTKRAGTRFPAQVTDSSTGAFIPTQVHDSGQSKFVYGVDLKSKAKAAAAMAGVSLAEWLEDVILIALAEIDDGK